MKSFFLSDIFIYIYIIKQIKMKTLIFFLLISFFSYAQTQEEIDSYFNEIALRDEFDKISEEHPSKWRSSLAIYLEGNYTTDFKNELIRIKNELIDLTGLSISLTDKEDSANVFIYVGDAEYFTKKYKPDIAVDKWADGYCEGLRKKGTFTFYKANIFISDFPGAYKDEIYPLVQKTALREELTQSLGLFNDSMKYPDSIFYNSKADRPVLEFSEIDKAIIRKLYQ
jgi:hypothetical protein